MVLATALIQEQTDMIHTFFVWSLFYPEYNQRLDVMSQSAILFLHMDCGLTLI